MNLEEIRELTIKLAKEKSIFDIVYTEKGSTEGEEDELEWLNKSIIVEPNYNSLYITDEDSEDKGDICEHTFFGTIKAKQSITLYFSGYTSRKDTFEKEYDCNCYFYFCLKKEPKGYFLECWDEQLESPEYEDSNYKSFHWSLNP